MLIIKLCAGTNCSFKGSLDILEYLENDETLSGKINIEIVNCIDKKCKPDNAPVVMVGDEIILKATLDKVLLKVGEKTA